MNRLVWFRNDLRLKDNQTLCEALQNECGSISFLYIYDERWDQLSPENYPRKGSFKKKYLAQSLVDLKKNLQKLGADLICTLGDATQIIPQVCAQMDIQHVYWSRSNSFEEHCEDVKIEKQLTQMGRHSHNFETQTLFCRSDLKDFKFDVATSFSKLRKSAEKSWPVRPPLAPPAQIKNVKTFELATWDYEKFLALPNSDRGIQLSGGETAEHAELQTFFFEEDALRTYKQTRNGLINHPDSSKFSAALALGCVSARTIYHEVRSYEKTRTSNLSTLWFIYELLWRDHFQFAAARRGPKLFTDEPDGDWTVNPSTTDFESWRLGQTESSFINAAMIELATTGWMSNRMRQNTASFLVHNLKVSWQKGARWFESCLIDYDPCSNWGNWSYIAGAGKENSPHIFDVEQQRQTFDPDGAFEKLWLKD